ncbi:MAG: hypothetical protein AAFP90_14220, partial [Planctomycetota bacterium]
MRFSGDLEKSHANGFAVLLQEPNVFSGTGFQVVEFQQPKSSHSVGDFASHPAANLSIDNTMQIQRPQSIDLTQHEFADFFFLRPAARNPFVSFFERPFDTKHRARPG